MAIVLVLMLMLIAIAAGGAALAATLSTRHNADRDQRSKRALQAADAGIQAELYRVNQTNMGGLTLTKGLSLSSIVSQLLVCPIPQISASGGTSNQIVGLSFDSITTVGNPCPLNSKSKVSNPGPDNEAVGHHDYFNVQFQPGLSNIGDFIVYNPKIVADGVDDSGDTTAANRYVTRRVEAVMPQWMPWRTLEAMHDLTVTVPPAVSALGVKLAGATTFNGTAAAGNNLNITGTAALANTFTAANAGGTGLTEPSALDYCNAYTPTNITVTLTLGNITKPSSSCSSLVNRSTISISSSKANCYQNSSPTTSCLALFGSAYDSTKNAIYCSSGCGTLTFQPGDYVFCNFMYNGVVSLNPSSTQAVRIFIDSPSSSRCNGVSGYTGQSSPFVNGLGNFIATKGAGGNPIAGTLAATHPSQAQIYVVGNGTNDGTTVTATGNTGASGQAMFLYAPTSNVTVTAGTTCVLGTCVSTGTIAGAIIGYDLNVAATTVTQDLGLLNYPLSSSLGPFYVKQYVECTPQYPLPSDPTSGC